MPEALLRPSFPRLAHALAFVVVVMLWLVASAPALAQSTDTGTRNGVQGVPSSRQEKAARGWFWYEDPVEEVPPRELKVEPPPSATVPKVAAKPPAFSVQWIRDNISVFRDAAINNPTRDNVALYMYVQKLAMDKSEQFALRVRQVAMTTPALDESSTNPTASFALMQMSSVKKRGREAALRAIAAQTSLWYFFKSNCPWCHKQNPLLRVMQENYQFNILPISLDRKGLDDGSFPNWVPDQGQASVLHVTSTPTIYLVHPETKSVVFLSEGLKSLSDLRTRLIEVAHAEKWISDDLYEKAVSGLPSRYLTDNLPADLGSDVDPQVLLKVLERAGGHMNPAQSVPLNQAEVSNKELP